MNDLNGKHCWKTKIQTKLKISTEQTINEYKESIHLNKTFKKIKKKQSQTI